MIPQQFLPWYRLSRNKSMVSARKFLSQSVILCIHAFKLSKNVGWEYIVICTFQLQNIKIFCRHHDLTHNFGSYHSHRDHLLMTHSLLHLVDMFSNNCHVQFPLHLIFFLQGWDNCSILVGWYSDPLCATVIQCTSLSRDSSSSSSYEERGLRTFVDLDTALRGIFSHFWLGSDNAGVD